MIDREESKFEIWKENGLWDGIFFRRKKKIKGELQIVRVLCMQQQKVIEKEEDRVEENNDE